MSDLETTRRDAPVSLTEEMCNAAWDVLKAHGLVVGRDYGIVEIAIVAALAVEFSQRTTETIEKSSNVLLFDFVSPEMKDIGSALIECGRQENLGSLSVADSVFRAMLGACCGKTRQILVAFLEVSDRT